MRLIPRGWTLGAAPATERLEGALTALVTPFRDGAVDTAALAALCLRQVRAGTAALVVCGPAGEAPALSAAEHRQVTETAVAAVAGRVPVVAGCTAPATAAAIELAVVAAAAGASAILCAPPPGSRLTQDGIVAHLRAISAAAAVPVLLCDAPARTGMGVSDATVAGLFEAGLIVGIEDATADLARPARLRALCGDAFVQYSGDDATAAPHRAAGGHGCISVSANLAPATCAALHRAWAAADLPEFARLRDMLAPLHSAMALEPGPAPAKMALAIAGLCRGELRLPLLPAGAAAVRALAPLVAVFVAAEYEAAGRPRFSVVG